MLVVHSKGSVRFVFSDFVKMLSLYLVVISVFRNIQGICGEGYGLYCSCEAHDLLYLKA